VTFHGVTKLTIMLKRLVLDVYERADISLLKSTLLTETAPHLHKFLSLVKGLTS